MQIHHPPFRLVGLPQPPQCSPRQNHSNPTFERRQSRFYLRPKDFTRGRSQPLKTIRHGPLIAWAAQCSDVDTSSAPARIRKVLRVAHCDHEQLMSAPSDD